MWRESMKPVPHCDSGEQKGDGRGNANTTAASRRLSDRRLLSPLAHSSVDTPTSCNEGTIVSIPRRSYFRLDSGSTVERTPAPWAVVSNNSVLCKVLVLVLVNANADHTKIGTDCSEKQVQNSHR